MHVQEGTIASFQVVINCASEKKEKKEDCKYSTTGSASKYPCHGRIIALPKLRKAQNFDFRSESSHEPRRHRDNAVILIFVFGCFSGRNEDKLGERARYRALFLSAT